MKNVFGILVVGGLLAAAGPVIADEAGKLSVQTVVQKEEQVNNADGSKTTQLVAVESVVPGEEVVYTVTYTNISSESTDNIVISNPIPAQLTYVHGSAFGPGTEISFSVDGGKTFASPEQLVVATDGAERAATPEDFTNVRWVVQASLAAGDRGFARFRARLN